MRVSASSSIAPSARARPRPAQPPIKPRAANPRPGASGDDEEWRDRCRAWVGQADAATPARKRRRRAAHPLILTGHGVSLRIERGTLLIRDGLTHYPQERRAHRFFKGGLDLPPRILILDGSGALTFDVLAWLHEQGVPLVRIAWDGSAATAIGGAGYSADPMKAMWQRDIRKDEKRRTTFMTDLVQRKLRAQIDCLENVLPKSRAQEMAVEMATERLRRLKQRPVKTTDALRALEGRVGSAYFGAWRGLPLNLKSTKRHPTPDDWRCFSTRYSLANRRNFYNINASHPLNAMLNYAYAVLQTELTLQVIAAGYDPTLGVMHHIRFGKPAFVFDLMEPLRPVVDAEILKFTMAETFSGGDFTLRADGVVRLNPQLARRAAQIAASVLNSEVGLFLNLA